MSKNPVAYAEQELGVHRTHEEAVELAAALNNERLKTAGFSAAIRWMREQLADREAEVVAEQRAANADMSATAFEKHIKTALQSDTQMRHLRREIMLAQDEHDLAEVAAKNFDRKLDIAIARLHELGGLLTFYAAARRTS